MDRRALQVMAPARCVIHIIIYILVLALAYTLLLHRAQVVSSACRNTIFITP